MPVDQGLWRIGPVDRDPSPYVGSVLGIDEHGRAIQMRRVRIEGPAGPTDRSANDASAAQPSDGTASPAQVQVGDPQPLAHGPEPGVQGQSFWHKAREFLKVVSGPKVEDEVFAARMATCSECPAVKRVDERLYCGACGCTNWRLAELTRKLRYARLKCPLGRFGVVHAPTAATEASPPVGPVH